MSSYAQKYFLAISIFFGLIYVFLIPPFQAPDEDNHLFRCYQLSSTAADQLNQPVNRLGGVIPSSLLEYSSQFNYLRFNYEGRIDIKQLQHFNEKKLDKVNTQFVDFSNTAMYFPSSYLTHIPVMALASKLNLKPSIILYLMRLISLFTWIAFVFWAFKFHESQLFFFICLLPSLLVLHSSVSADVISNAIAFFLLAFIFYLRKLDQKLNYKQVLLFAFLMIILSINKIAYLPLLLLWFLLPFGKCSSRKFYFSTFTVITVSCILVTALWANHVNEKYITYENYHPEYRESQQIKPNGDPIKQMKFIISHPVEFTINTIKSYLSVVPATLAHLTGKFGWEKNYLPWWMIGLLLINLLAIILSTKLELTDKDRLWLLSISFSVLYLLSMIMYGIYSAVGNDYIHNLGGKYLIPILPLIAYAFSFKFLNIKWVSRLTIPIVFLAHFTMIIGILQRYYF